MIGKGRVPPEVVGDHLGRLRVLAQIGGDLGPHALDGSEIEARAGQGEAQKIEGLFEGV